MNNGLFVARLPNSLTHENLRALFEEIGPVLSLKRPKDNATGLPRSFAFVVMSTPELAERAIKELHGRVVEGSDIAVMYNTRPNGFRPPTYSKRESTSSITWENRLDAMLPTITEPGSLGTAKISLVGRPGRIVLDEDVTMIALEHRFDATRFLPRGLPMPPQTTTLYTVYISSKMWSKVAKSIENPEDFLIMDGHVMVDVEAGAIAVIATAVTTKFLMQAKGLSYREDTEKPQEDS